MAFDYASIRVDNERRYGTDIGRIGPMLLADRYADRTHFVFELLQNAEDALARRSNWQGSRRITFNLYAGELRVAHFGQPFDERDVRGICGIAESTKDLTAIGRFGIGFKSVYAFTDRPEVHSGEEDFAIESFVWPTTASPIERQHAETVFVLPLRSDDATAHADIAEGLRRLGPRTLLFLQQIEEIGWSIEGGPSGLYLRGKPEAMGESVRRVSLRGQAEGRPDVEETWLVFSREASTAPPATGRLEIAFSLSRDKESGLWSVQPVSDSPLVVFFPTVLTTHLGFLVQGPYRTTPSRDNVPPRDPWNVKLVQETAALLLDALGALKSMNLLDVVALQCLPIERAKYPEGSMFAPIFDAVRSALASEPLLPRAVGGWTAAKNARLARTQELRELLDSKQLAALLNVPEEVHWLSGDITRDMASTLRNYLLYELKVSELTPELILTRLNKQFLEAQPDEWILKLYEFLAGQSALVREGRLSNIPIVRVEGGSHVVAESNGQPQAFLPSEIRTDFPTVPRSVCNTAKALEFLKALGLTEPDAVDDVVRNVIPRYMRDTVEADREKYEADLKRILNAFGTQHRGQRDKLISALKDARFVMSVDAGDGRQNVSKPADVYLATERLKKLFAGVAGVMLVDDSYSCLKGEEIRELLDACGAVRYLRPIPDNSLSCYELSELRVKAGHAETSGQKDRVTDWTLLGLKALLDTFPKLDTEERRTKARLLWEELGNLEERRGRSVFAGEYTWTHYGSYRALFDAAFVRALSETAWVPDQDGNLQQPRLVLFDSLGWQANPFLLSTVRFKPPILDQLAKEAGIEPGVLDLLKKLGLTSEADLKTRLGIMDEPKEPESKPGPGTVDDALKNLLGNAPKPTPPVPDPAGPEPTGSGTGGPGRTGAGGGTTSDGGTREGTKGGDRKPGQGAVAGAGKRSPGSRGGRPFISYVGAHADEDERDPDELNQQARMELEEKAFQIILAREPQLQRTPTQNPSYDLFDVGADSKPTRWIEVKAMTGGLHDRPVGLSRTQFDFAREHGEAYWLYVVEHAGAGAAARVVCIQDPAGKARTFTFDHGWLNVADVDGPGDADAEQEGQEV